MPLRRTNREMRLDEFESLIHHIATDEKGKEVVHHCFLYDHIANLFEQEHLVIKDGKAFFKGKEIKDGVYHVIAGLEPHQDVCWSDEEAEKHKIKPKKLRWGMSYNEKAKEW